MQWKPDSWLLKHIMQIPPYNEFELNIVKNKLSLVPSIVSFNEILNLKGLLSKVFNRNAFIIHMGDCAESFSEFTKQKLIQQTNFINTTCNWLSQSTGLNIVSIGRIAGQYAKPRTNEVEIVDGESILSYRGDIINNLMFSGASRNPCPYRMLEAHRLSYLASQYIQSYNNSSDNIVYLSHEALLLHYEECLTRRHDEQNWYNFSTHLPWIGVRTASVNSAHLEYCRGINNPIGLKIYSEHSVDELYQMIRLINPNNHDNRLVLIHRFGLDKIQTHLPVAIDMIKRSNLNVIWMCDPMHGNTKIDDHGRKYRLVPDIKSELELAFKIHHNLGTYLGGIHIESTFADLSECCDTLVEANNYTRSYMSLMDPRLNRDQTNKIIAATASFLR